MYMLGDTIAKLFRRLIAAKLHEIHQLDVTDYIKQLGRPSYPKIVNTLSYFKMPQFQDDEQQQLR